MAKIISGSTPEQKIDINPNEKVGMDLNPEDFMFMEYIQNSISIDGKLPFKIPVNSLPRLIVDSALWFYRECDEATEEVWYMIKNEDLKHDDSGNSKFNISCKLPEQIESIFRVFPITNPIAGIAARFAVEPMYYAAAVNTLNNYSTSYTNAYRQFNREYAFEESVVRMFEYASTKSLFRRGVTFNYNNNTRTFRVLSDTSKDLMLHCFKRIELKYLYNDINFRRYVIAYSLENLGAIISSFDFKLPGGVTINLDSISSRGAERRKEIEDIIKSESSGADLMIIK